MRPKIALLLIMLLAFAARFVALGGREFRNDESFTCNFTQIGFDQIIGETFALKEPHPVGSYFIQHAWYLITGSTEWAMRFPTAWFGVLAVPLMWALSETIRRRTRAFPQAVSLIAAFVIAVSPYAILHSRTMRMYGMHLTVTLASMVIFARIVAGHRRWTDYAALIFTGFIALHLHYYAAFILVAQSLFIGWLWLTSPEHRTRRFIGLWIVSQFILGLLYVPWLIPASRLVTGYAGVSVWPGAREMLVDWLSSYTIGEYFHSWETYNFAIHDAFAVIGGLIALLGLVKLFRNRKLAHWRVFVLIYFVITPMAVAYAALSRPVFEPRYLIASVPAFFLILAYALVPDLAGRVRKISRAGKTGAPQFGQIAALAVSAAMGLVLVYGFGHELIPYFADEFNSADTHFKTLVQFANRYTGAFSPAQERFAINFPDRSIPCYYGNGPLALVTIPPRKDDLAHAREMVQGMVAADVRRVIFQEVDSPFWDEHHVARQALEEQFSKLEEVFTGQWVLRIYGRPAQLESLNATYMAPDNQVILAAAQVHANRTDNVAQVDLEWARAGQAPTGSEKFFVHVVPDGGTGTPIAQLDLPLTQDLLDGRARAYGIRLPENTVAGRYHVRIGIYDPAQPGQPRLKLADGRDAVELAFQLD